MKLDYKLEILADMLLATEKISLWIYTTSCELVYSNSPWENELHNIFYLSQNMGNLNALSDSRSIVLDDDFGLTWIAHRYEGDEFMRGIYVLGPILVTDISEKILRERMSIKDMSISSQIKFLNLTSNIPVIPRVYFMHLNNMLYYLLFHEKNSPDYAYNEVSKESQVPALSNTLSIPAAKNYHGTFAIEKKLLDNVTSGNIYYEDPQANSNEYAFVGTLSNGDPIRQIKNEIIAFVTLTSRAAIQGGLDYEKSLSLADYYIQKTEASFNGNELSVIAKQMYGTYIQQVHAFKHQTKYSYAVSESLAMIHSNIPRSTDIGDIAKALGYSTYYLTRQILKETGKSYKEHLTNAKIEYAKKQLLDPVASISSISEELQYSTPSYFSAQFKAVVGCTPKEYRRKRLQS